MRTLACRHSLPGAEAGQVLWRGGKNVHVRKLTLRNTGQDAAPLSSEPGVYVWGGSGSWKNREHFCGLWHLTQHLSKYSLHRGRGAYSCRG